MLDRHRLMTVVALGLFGLVACAGDGSDGSAADRACELLTTSEADELLGTPTNGASEDTDRSHGTYCEWVSTDSDDDGDAASDAGDGGIEPYFLSVEDERGAGAVQSFESGKVDTGEREDGTQREISVVQGLGDDAYFDEPHGLNVRDGDRVFSTYAAGNAEHPLSADASKTIERRAADIIVGRIGDPQGGADVDAAVECGRTRRCSGTRYHACDLLDEAEVARLTGWTVTKVDGTSIPAGSAKAAICDYLLENPSLPEGSLREFRRVEVRVEPDEDEAAEAYRRIRRQADDDHDARDLPELGPRAFSSPLFQEVYVLDGGTLLSVSYEAELPSGADDHSPAIEQGAIDLAEVALSHLEGR
jgi:hypothetical protein